MSNLVPEADGIKLMREGEPGPLAGYSNSGVKPRPLRKKAFYRAWRRHELVAVVPYIAYQNVSASKMFSAVYSDPYCPDNYIYVMYPWDKT